MSRAPVAALAIALVAGCSSQQLMAPTLDVAPTWYRDVLPIVQTRCQGCHSPGGIGPFELMSYDDAKPHLDEIAYAVKERIMPPWLPSNDPSCMPLADSRRLSDQEIETLVTWAGGEHLLGDVKDAPAPAAPDKKLDRIDVTLDPGLSYKPQPPILSNGEKGQDDYHCFIVDPKLTSDRDVVGFEVLPGSRTIVHHVLLFPADPVKAAAADAKTAEPGWTCFGGPGVGGADSPLGGWVPGAGATRFPATTGISVSKGQVIVMQIHYNLANDPKGVETDRTTVNLQYSDSPVPNSALYLPLPDNDFAIPPNAVGYTHGIDYTNQIPVRVWGVTPHMHVKGQKIKVELDNRCIIDIPDWDFHWQQFYFFEGGKTIDAPVGSKVKLTCTWNNPTDQTVTWGEGTSDEMCLNYFFVTN